MSNLEQHFAVSGFVTNKEWTKLLMVFHKKLGVWVIPGGHLEPNELPHEGALREVSEETGVNAVVLDASSLACVESPKERQLPSPVLTLREVIPGKNGASDHIHIDLIYGCMADEQAPLRKQEEEVNEVKWMSLREVLDSNTFASVKALANNFLSERGDTKCGNSDSS